MPIQFGNYIPKQLHSTNYGGEKIQKPNLSPKAENVEEYELLSSEKPRVLSWTLLCVIFVRFPLRSHQTSTTNYKQAMTQILETENFKLEF